MALLGKCGEEERFVKTLIDWFEKLPHWLLAGLVALLAFLQYSNTLQHGYTLDDEVVITTNTRVQEGVKGIPEHFQRYQSDALSDQYGYRPVTLSSFSLDVSLFGLEASSGHTMQVLYFAGLCVVLYFLLKGLFLGMPKLLVFGGMLLFVSHPLHVEVVANLKSRDEILSLLFGGLAMLASLEVIDRQKWWMGILALGALVLAMLSKESAVTFAAVIPLVFLLRKSVPVRTKLITGGLAFVLGGAIWLGVNAFADARTVDQKASTAGEGIFREHKVLGNALFQHHLPPQRYATGVSVLGLYLRDFLLPYPLVYYSGYNQVPVRSWGDGMVWLALLSQLALLGFGIWGWRRHLAIPLGVGFYFLTVFPYTHFLRPLDDAMANRFMFTPSLGLIMALMGLSGYLWERYKPVPASKRAAAGANGRPQQWLALLPFLLILFYAPLTMARNKAWKDNLTLFKTDLPHLDNCARCHFHYAYTLTEQYPKSGNQGELQGEIIEHFKRAIEISDETYNAQIALGRAYFIFGKWAEGNAVLEKVVKKWPDEGRAWHQLGYGYYLQKDYIKAIPAFQNAVRLAPDREDSPFFLAWSYFQTGSHAEAIALLEQGLKRWPQLPSWYESLSDMQFALGNNLAGMDYLQKGVQQLPQHKPLYDRLIQRYQNFGDTSGVRVYMDLGRKNGLY